MNWEAIGAIGQVLGSIAVFVTLIYLAVQTSHARRETRRAVRQGVTEGWSTILQTRLTNRQLMDLKWKVSDVLGGLSVAFVDALHERAGVTREEAQAINYDEWITWNQNVQVINFRDELTPAERRHYDEQMRFAYGSLPISRLFYESTRQQLQPEVVRHIDALLSRPA